MKRLGIIIAVLLLLVIGGGLTAQLISSGQNGIIPVLRQTDDADASVSDMVPWKAEQFFLAVGFILFNVLGMGLTIMAVVWLLDRGIRRSQAEAAANAPASPARRQQKAAE
ncbi:MAG: hypothetical protein DIU68_017735 [Chloroflexota bacterium]